MGGLTGPEAFNLEISSVEMKGKELVPRNPFHLLTGCVTIAVHSFLV